MPSVLKLKLGCDAQYSDVWRMQNSSGCVDGRCSRLAGVPMRKRNQMRLVRRLAAKAMTLGLGSGKSIDLSGSAGT